MHTRLVASDRDELRSRQSWVWVKIPRAQVTHAHITWRIHASCMCALLSAISANMIRQAYIWSGRNVTKYRSGPAWCFGAQVHMHEMCAEKRLSAIFLVVCVHAEMLFANKKCWQQECCRHVTNPKTNMLCMYLGHSAFVWTLFHYANKDSDVILLPPAETNTKSSMSGLDIHFIVGTCQGNNMSSRQSLWYVCSLQNLQKYLTR